MSKKTKVRRLTDEQYNAYIATLKDDPALYSPGGELVPSEFAPDNNQKKLGD
jgi:hypothetical protein